MGANVAALAATLSSDIRTAALVSPAGGLAQAWMRSADDEIRAGALRATMGPVVWTRRSEGFGSDSGCALADVSLRMSLADLDRTVDVEAACIAAADAMPGATVVVRDLTNGARGCARLDESASAFVPIEADSGDRWTLDVYPPEVTELDLETCEPTDGSLPSVVFEVFGVESGPPDSGRCPECARFRRVEYPSGSPLIFPAGGLGRRRQSPGLLRYEAFLDLALHGADPLQYLPGDEDEAPLLVATVGDGELPFASAVRLGRASGALPFLPADAPSHLSRFAAPGGSTAHDELTALHAVEGAPWLERTPVSGGPRFLADPDDLSEGIARFSSDGAPSADGVRPVTPASPVRAPFFTVVYVSPEGAHGPSPALLFSPTTPFDASQYLINHVGRFLATGGREIRHRDAPTDHLCFADSSCDLLRE
jgi:hypothetical protein